MVPVPAGRSERLRFEPLVPSHVPLLSKALLDPAVYAFIDGAAPESTEHLATEIERRAAGPPPSQPLVRWWNVAVLSSDGTCGFGRLEATLIEDRAEIAYLFGSAHWGNGYATEAMRWLHDRLAEDGTAAKLWATVLPANERSVKLLRCLGYTRIASGWPDLASYDDGDLVFCRSTPLLSPTAERL